MSTLQVLYGARLPELLDRHHRAGCEPRLGRDVAPRAENLTWALHLCSTKAIVRNFANYNKAKPNTQKRANFETEFDRLFVRFRSGV